MALELGRAPGTDVARRHVDLIAATARAGHSAHRREVIRLGAVILAATLVASTSGVALAGSLPRPVQGFVADAARLLPVPLPVPYPSAPAEEYIPDPVHEPVVRPVDQTDPADEGEAQVESTKTPAPDESAVEPNDSGRGESEPREDQARDRDGGHRWEDDSKSKEDRQDDREDHNWRSDDDSARDRDEEKRGDEETNRDKSDRDDRDQERWDDRKSDRSDPDRDRDRNDGRSDDSDRWDDRR